jgi:hypothetical protein
MIVMQLRNPGLLVRRRLNSGGLGTRNLLPRCRHEMSNVARAEEVYAVFGLGDVSAILA